jgi:hypothetical protein
MSGTAMVKGLTAIKAAPGAEGVEFIDDAGNVQIDTRWAARDADRVRRYASEMVALILDVIGTRERDRRTFAASDPLAADSIRDYSRSSGRQVRQGLARPGT